MYWLLNITVTVVTDNVTRIKCKKLIVYQTTSKIIEYNSKKWLLQQKVIDKCSVQTIMVDSKEAAATSSILRYSTPAPDTGPAVGDAGSHGPSSVTLQESKKGILELL